MTIRRTDPMSDALRYVEEIFTHKDSDIEEITGSLTEQEKIMQISPMEARLLQTIIALAGVKTVVEIGVLGGYSAIHMAKMLPRDGKIFAIDRIHDYITRARNHAKRCGVEDKIEFLEGEALAVLEKLATKGPFDMIFIDADKAAYPQYLDWAEKHIRQGGVILGDNSFLFGHVYQPVCPPEIPQVTYHAMQEFNKRLANPAKYVSILIPTREGLTVAVKK